MNLNLDTNLNHSKSESKSKSRLQPLAEHTAESVSVTNVAGGLERAPEEDIRSARWFLVILGVTLKQSCAWLVL